jgi:hypothetical protein
VPGILVYLGWTGVIGWMLWQVWQRGDALSRTGAVGVAGGLLAHLVFSMGDAITLFDRFIFLYWLLLGLGTALFVRVRT